MPKQTNTYEHIDKEWIQDMFEEPQDVCDWLIEYEEVIGVSYHCTIDARAFMIKKNKDLWNAGHKLYEEHIKERTGIQDYVKARKYYFDNDCHKTEPAFILDDDGNPKAQKLSVSPGMYFGND